MTTEINYSTQYAGTEHHYRLKDGVLIYRGGDTELEVRLDLRRADYSMKQTRKFHRLWYGGLAIVAVPLWGLGTIYIKDRVILASGTGLILWGFLVVGLLLLIFYHRPTKCYEVRTSRGDKLWIFTDPAEPRGAEELVEAMRQVERGMP